MSVKTGEAKERMFLKTRKYTSSLDRMRSAVRHRKAPPPIFLEAEAEALEP
jgi:hypothetical protein